MSHTLPTRLDMTSLTLSPFHERDFDSPSPYPPSSPSTDSSDVESVAHSLNTGLRSSIAALPESKLRSIIVKLADSNPRFQHAIMKELAYTHAIGDSPPTTPTMSKQRKPRRRKTRRNCKNLSVAATQDSFEQKRRASPSYVPPQEAFAYHPGHLDEEVYEFLSRTADEAAFKVVRTIAMWSCCDEDEWSPGCAVVPYANPADHERDERIMIEFFHPDVLPDSDLERGYEDDRHGSFARLSKHEES
ncbi:hypothetical protein BDZ97DRAFT_1915466 [Flammula alnicola]|nr:hypothetical protein BDZ97DRAFT_1915466 [Flammula alnicola]